MADKPIDYLYLWEAIMWANSKPALAAVNIIYPWWLRMLPPIEGWCVCISYFQELMQTFRLFQFSLQRNIQVPEGY